MKATLSIFSNAAKLRALGNAFVIDSLEKAGLKGIVPSHGDVLRHLFDKKACSMTELARSIGRTKSTVTVLVEKLEREGYICRVPNESDSRGVLVQLTEKGLALRPVFEDISDGLVGLVSKKLSAEEAAVVDRLLRKCVN